MLPSKMRRTHFDERLPIYEQIIQRFRRQLVSGELEPGQRIASIRDLALELGVNTNTIQRAYQEMERVGLIFSRRGMGYFIVEDGSVVESVKCEMVRQAVESFLDEMRSLGFDDTAIVEELKKHTEGGDGNGTAAS